MKKLTTVFQFVFRLIKLYEIVCGRGHEVPKGLANVDLEGISEGLTVLNYNSKATSHTER